MSVKEKLNTINNKISTIDDSINRMKTALNLPTSTPLEEITVSIETGGGGGGATTKSNIYKVASIRERDAITDMVEGDLCVIHYNAKINMNSSAVVSEITFPATVVLPSAVSGSLYTMLESEDGSTMIDLSLTSSRMRATIMGDNYISLSYSSSDGKTYTLSGGADKVITSSSPIKCTSNWNDMFGYFMQVGGAAFDGVYEYKDGAWGYANLGLNPDLSTIFPSTTVYTNSGFQSGFFPLKNGSWSSTFAADSVKTIQDAMHNLDNHTSLFAGALSTTAVIDIFNKVLKGDCRYLFSSTPITELDLTTWDFSNVTSLREAFTGAKNLTTVNLQNADLSNVVNFNNIFLNATALTTVDFRGATFGSEEIYVNGMFGNTNIEHILFDDDVKLKVSTLSVFEGMNNSLGPTDEAVEAFLTHIDDSVLSTKTNALNHAFRHCSRITRLDFSHLDLSNLTGIIHGIMNCANLQFLDLRTVDFQKFTNTDPNIGSFAFCLTDIPTDCLIIVGDDTQKSILQSKRPALTNIKTVVEYEGVVEEPAEMSEQDIINYIADNQYSSTIDGVGSYKYFASTHGLYDRVIFYNEDGSLCDFFYDLYPCDSEEAAAAKAAEDQSNVGMYSITWVGAAGTKVYWKTTTSDQDKTKTIDEWIDSYSFIFTEKMATNSNIDMARIEETANALYCGNNRLVYNNGGIYKIVIYYDENTLTGMEDYYTYADASAAAADLTRIKDFYIGDSSVKEVVQYDKYIIVVYNAEVYNTDTVETIQNKYANLSPVYQ